MIRAALVLVALICLLSSVSAQEYASLRAGQLAAGAHALRVWVNGAPIHDLRDFKAVSDWADVASGPVLIELKRSDDPNTVIALLETNLRTGFRYLVAVVGVPGSLELAVYTDHPRRAPTDFGGLRVINAVPDSGALRLHASDNCRESDLLLLGPFAFKGQNSVYDSYEYSWRGPAVVCDGQTIVLQLPQTESGDGYAVRGKAMTLFLVGSLAAGTIEAFRSIDAE